MTYQPTQDAAIVALRALGLSLGAANGIVRDWPDLTALASATPEDLKRHGVKRAQADRIAAAFRLVRLADGINGAGTARDRFTAPNHVAVLARADYGDLPQEHFAVYYLNARQEVIRRKTIAVGSLSQVDVHPRELFAGALQGQRAHSVILVHNHPSGDPTPSNADIQLTQRMWDAGNLLGVPVLDHVIVTPHDSCSMATLGVMPV